MCCIMPHKTRYTVQLVFCAVQIPYTWVVFPQWQLFEWGGREGTELKASQIFLKINIIFAITVETWLDRTQQVAKELNLGKAAVLSAQSELSAEI